MTAAESGYIRPPPNQSQNRSFEKRGNRSKAIRELVEEITTLMAFEALKDVPTKLVEITTPLER